jgi:hypothetical protein
MYDALGSITIGLLMGGVSLFLVQKNMQLLGGQRAQREDEAVALLEADGAVRAQKNAFSQCELVRETCFLFAQTSSGRLESKREAKFTRKRWFVNAGPECTRRQDDHTRAGHSQVRRTTII